MVAVYIPEQRRWLLQFDAIRVSEGRLARGDATSCDLRAGRDESG